MNWLSDSAKEQIRLFAASKPEQETCGFVLKDKSVVLLDNVSSEPAEKFEISPVDYLKHEEELLGVWHSHLRERGFSPLDQQVMAADVLPWAVYCLQNDTWSECDPGEVAPFEGRPFVFGIYDCYSLVADYLKALEVNLPEWPRGKWGEWNTPEFTPFDDMRKEVGRPIKPGDQKPGDILLLNLGDYQTHTDHVGVFTSKKHFLHHPAQSESRLQTFGSYWQKRLKWIIRPHELCRS